MRLKSKTSGGRLIEVIQQSNGWYGLYVNGSLYEQSADLNYILSRYDSM